MFICDARRAPVAGPPDSKFTTPGRKPASRKSCLLNRLWKYLESRRLKVLEGRENAPITIVVTNKWRFDLDSLCYW